ncbi:oxidoreductase [Arthrobacter agilis]|uniref:molybdopterin-dependent oxidoreductase n=1 Tax=Arthrobacter agilis TaxID=37921 RepID=UPI000B35DC53|nr:molybdopterin-dependent oxidoreductase [Arthrobacter agilis]OUM40789.1 oxidoreductase [Arthrobacter agilis]PPB45393.1 oxidoreductase [Arthrobacter agilis]TPV28105.1 oxidoreductase [Arthrobacter agilis]
MRRRAWAGISGGLAVGLGVIGGELTAAALSPSVTPVSAVGSAVIDGLPPGVKDWAISWFGTADKAVLLATIAVLIAGLALAAGAFEDRRAYTGRAVILGFGALGALAVASRPQASLVSFAAPVVATLVAVLVLDALIRALARWVGVAGEDLPARSSPARRRFLQGAGAAAAVAVATGGAATAVRTSQTAVTRRRSAITLPAPTESGAPPPPEGSFIPDGAELDVDGISDLVTASGDFYRIDTALVVPVVDPGDWTLRVTGLVEREIEITFDELLAEPLVERYVTLACVSNTVGGGLTGNARWLGWPVRDLLARAGIRPGADMVLSTSVDGFTAGTPLEALTDARDSLIAVGMNGAPLPVEHGFPVRLVVPGLFGFVSATKWVSELKVTRYADDAAYWSTRGWSERGPVKTSSRVDVPRSNARVPAGGVVVAGVAWAQHRGVAAVDVRADGGPWQRATLATAISADTWCQYSITLDLAAGPHTVQCRAVDRDGQAQSEATVAPAPDGSEGLHTVTFTVT